MCSSDLSLVQRAHGELLQQLAEPLHVRLYTDLADLPCILILCEKGKMGDTFPASFRFYDLRLRYGNKCCSRSSLEQDLGRACRYRPGSEYEKRRYPLPTVLLAAGAMTELRLRAGQQPGAKGDKLLKMVPDVRMVPSGKRAPQMPDTPTDAQLSERYRATFLPRFKAMRSQDLRHFDARAHVSHAAMDDAPDPTDWVGNRRHFLLQGLPQVGKTGALLWFMWLLWREVAPPAPTAEELTKVEEEEGGADDGGSKATWFREEVHVSELDYSGTMDPGEKDAELMGRYPPYEVLVEKDFVDTPSRGKYGDQIGRAHV